MGISFQKIAYKNHVFNVKTIAKFVMIQNVLNVFHFSFIIIVQANVKVAHPSLMEIVKTAQFHFLKQTLSANNVSSTLF